MKKRSHSNIAFVKQFSQTLYEFGFLSWSKKKIHESQFRILKFCKCFNQSEQVTFYRPNKTHLILYLLVLEHKYELLTNYFVNHCSVKPLFAAVSNAYNCRLCVYIRIMDFRHEPGNLKTIIQMIAAALLWPARFSPP